MGFIMSLKDAMITEEMSKKLDAAETVEEALAILKENGIETTEEELSAMLREQDGELTDENLENVAGGVAIVFPVSVLMWWKYYKIRNTLSKWVRKLLGM